MPGEAVSVRALGDPGWAVASSVGADGVIRSALLSADRRYRYWLRHRVNPAMLGHVDSTLLLWIMLNPSTADHEADDPTIRRCAGFTRAWGFAGFIVVNLFAYRATDPADLADAAGAGVDPVGPDNEFFVSQMVRGKADRVVVAWGANPVAARSPVRDALIAADEPLWCLGVAKSGAPLHPLYLRADTPLVPWSMP